MKDLTVLTPPFLMAAVVIFAIVAFLRHEMGRKRADPTDLDDSISAAGQQPDDEVDSAAGTSASATSDT